MKDIVRDAPLTVAEVVAQVAQALESIAPVLPDAARVTARAVCADELPNARMLLDFATFELVFDPSEYLRPEIGVSIVEDVVHKLASVAWQRELAKVELNRPHRDDFVARTELDELLDDENVVLQLGGEILATELSLSSGFVYGLNGGARNAMADGLANAVASSFMDWQAWEQQAETDDAIDARLQNYAGVVEHALRRYVGLRGQFAVPAQVDLTELAALARNEIFDFMRAAPFLAPFAEQFEDE